MPSTEHTHRYAELTWPEVAERVADDPVCVIPVATLEDHGYHLPIDTDAVIAEALAERAVLARPEQSLLLPTVTHGYTPHHMDFPGSITIEWKRFVEYLVDIGKSLIHHGFRRILFVNGHGSNVPLVDMAARLLMLERRDVIAATFWYLSTPESAELLARTRDSDQPGGMAHACELETSLYLAIHPERVQMDKAVREIPDWDSDTVWMDWNDGPLSIKGQWSGWTESGVIGDATVATAEKGRHLARPGGVRRWRPTSTSWPLARRGRAGIIMRAPSRRWEPGREHNEITQVARCGRAGRRASGRRLRRQQRLVRKQRKRQAGWRVHDRHDQLHRHAEPVQLHRGRGRHRLPRGVPRAGAAGAQPDHLRGQLRQVVDA